MITFVARKEFEELNGESRKARKATVMKDLEEFLASGQEVCVVDSNTYNTVESCAVSYYGTIKRLYGSDMPVSVIRRKNQVFLVRK